VARPRDYKAEYARRQQRARARGFRGYWQERKARRTIGTQRRGRVDPKALDEQLRAAAKDADLYKQGMAAMRRSDFDEAERIARKLGYRKGSRKGPARRIFFYHP